MGRSPITVPIAMDAQQVSRWISDARFSPFLEAADGRHEHAIALYRWHAEISAACFETMHHFEVLLRNTIDHRLGRGQPDRPLSETWLQSDRVLTSKGLEQVDRAVARLRLADKPFTRGRVIAALNFGFWRALFGHAYEDLWRRELSYAFRGAGTRRSMNNPLERLNVLRNRLAHHDSILGVALERRFVEMVQIADWADPAAARWLRDGSRVVGLLQDRP